MAGSPKLSSLSVFFPSYNEEGNVERVVAHALEVLPSVAQKFEVIVVNDGSKDRTRELAEALARKDKRVRVVNHEVNRGYGGALISGIKAGRYDWIFFSDGDGQFDTAEIANLLPPAQNHDIVVGYRIHRQDSLMRKLNAWAWGTLVRALFHIPVRDIDCAFKLFRREVFDKVEVTAQGAMISTQILAAAVKRGFTIAEVGVHHYPRVAGQQTGAKLRVILRAFRELFKLYRTLK